MDRRTLAVLVALVALLALARLHTYDEPFETDISAEAMLAREVLGGRALYADMWDHKPPAVVLTHAVAQLVAGYGPGAIFLLNVVAGGAGLLGAYAAAAALASPAAGLWAAAFWTVLSGDLWLQGNQPNTEAFINACVVWALALYARAGDRARVGRFVAIGALFAWASLYKQVVLAPAALLALVHLALPPAGRTRLRALGDVGVVVAVGVAAWGATLAYFAAVGRFEAFWDAVVTFNRFYARGAGTSARSALLAFTPTWIGAEWLQSTVPLAALAALGTIAWLAAAPGRAWALFAALALATPVAIGMPGAFAAHYYQLWLPAFCVGGGGAVAALARLTRERLAWLPHVVGGATLVLLLALQLPYYLMPAEDWSVLKYGSVFVEEKKLARELDALLAPGETFYVWGSELGLYFWSRRSPVCGPCFVWPLTKGPLAASLTGRVMADLTRRPPEIFVVTDWTWDWINVRNPVIEWASRHYQPMPDGRRGPFSVYMRRGGALAARLERAAQR
ncbi:MAG: glycosyltransferase family 39 protein [Candidatus Rokubacteria bacterium]|nr:glycosyltransferase family 39 protein [Candidatus Rokubacteria bacterium]